MCRWKWHSHLYAYYHIIANVLNQRRHKVLPFSHVELCDKACKHTKGFQKKFVAPTSAAVKHIEMTNSGHQRVRNLKKKMKQMIPIFSIIVRIRTLIFLWLFITQIYNFKNVWKNLPLDIHFKAYWISEDISVTHVDIWYRTTFSPFQLFCVCMIMWQKSPS